MKSTGRYNHDSLYDLDHEITKSVEQLENTLKDIDCDSNDFNRLRIIQALIERSVKALDIIK